MTWLRGALPSSVTAAVTLMLSGAAAATVTVAPMGRFASMWACTAATISAEAGSMPPSTSTTLTVPAPFHRGNTLAAPTPATSSAHCS